MKIIRMGILAASLALSGCSYGEVYASHVSHPLAGEPVTPSHDAQGRAVEGYINAIGVSLGNCWGRVCVEQALSYDLTAGCDACLRGGPLLYEGRVSLKLFGGN